jgi:hypothetical protein
VLISVGLLLLFFGIVAAFIERGYPLGRLPGDFRIERGSFKFYFPLATCLLMSAVVSILVWVIKKFS